MNITTDCSREEYQFLQALEANPEDWFMRAAYGDYLDEQGRQKEAFCQRWMSKHQKRPFHRKLTKKGLIPKAPYQFAWFVTALDENDTFSVLPSVVFHRFPKCSLMTTHKFYPTQWHATNALADALDGLRKLLEI